MLNTAQKIGLARIAFRGVMGLRRVAGLSSRLTTVRGGIRWSLDLREGIDFSIYLLGGFEPATLKLYESLVGPGNTVLDIGANIGAHTLPLARLVGAEGRVIAFEPTEFAFGKLTANVALNPGLAPRIVLCQDMLVEDAASQMPSAVFSSWPLIAECEVHEKHKGRLMETRGARATTLDEAMERAQIGRLDFIKIDVDGNEPSVLMGGRRTLAHYRPVILMELAPYLFDDSHAAFEALLRLFDEYGYELIDAATARQLPIDAARLRALIPDGASRNVVLKAGKRP